MVAGMLALSSTVLIRSQAATDARASEGLGATAVAVREIDDPHTGDRWLLVRATDHPGAPGRMVLVSGPGQGERAVSARIPDSTSLVNFASFRPVIRGGDRVVVEESTPLVEARLEGVALGPAAAGAPIHVRLKLNGGVVKAVALGPGRAALADVQGGTQ